MQEADMARIAEFIDRALALVKAGKIPEGESIWTDEAARDALRAEVEAFASGFPPFVL
jgi:glycine/serine hydroxymethyltransferase